MSPAAGPVGWRPLEDVIGLRQRHDTDVRAGLEDSLRQAVAQRPQRMQSAWLRVKNGLEASTSRWRLSPSGRVMMLRDSSEREISRR